jgi:hypothetical protein
MLFFSDCLERKLGTIWFSKYGLKYVVDVHVFKVVSWISVV